MPARLTVLQGVGCTAAALLLASCSSATSTPTSVPPAPSSPPALPLGVPSVAAAPPPPSVNPVAPSPAPIGSPSLVPSPSPLASVGGPPEQSQVTLVYATNSGEFEFISVGQQQSIFQKYGLTVNLVFAASNASIASLISGESQIALSDGVSTSEAISDGADLKLVAYFDQTNPYAILSGAGYPTPDSLKGQTFAIGERGDTSDVSARIGLTSIGLQMDQDVTALAVGNSPARFAAVESGQVASAIDDATTYVPQAQQQGLHVLVNLQAQQIPYIAGGVVFSTDYLQSHPNTVLALLKGLMDANAYYADPANQQVCMQILAKDLGLSPDNPQVMTIYQAYYNRLGGKDPSPNPAAEDTILNALKTIDPKYQSLTDSQVLDPTPMNTLRAGGFQPSG